MIRRMTDEDVDVVGRIWLAASLQAHDFVPAEFWHADHKVMTSELLPGAHGYVHETAGEIDGFVVLGSRKRSNVMGALFVSPERQGRGIGTRLVDHVKTIRNPLATTVYRQNRRAFRFYKARGFRIVGEVVCEHTGCDEYEMEWYGDPDSLQETTDHGP